MTGTNAVAIAKQHLSKLHGVFYAFATMAKRSPRLAEELGALRALRRKAAGQLIAQEPPVGIVSDALGISTPSTSQVSGFSNIAS
jgi:hypothetical protein